MTTETAPAAACAEAPGEDATFLRELTDSRAKGTLSAFVVRASSGGEFAREWCARFGHKFLSSSEAADALTRLIESGTDRLILATHAKGWGKKSREAAEVCRRLIGPDSSPDVKLRFVRNWPEFPFRIEERVSLALSVDADLAPKGRTWSIGVAAPDRRRVLDFILSGSDPDSAREFLRFGRFNVAEWGELFQSASFEPEVAAENPTLPVSIQKLLHLATS